MFFTRAHKIFLVFPLLIFSDLSYAQDTVTIRANADKNKIVIGEQIQFDFKAEFPVHEPMRFFSIDSIPHFEILNRSKIDTVDKDQRITLSQRLTLTSFDSGHYVIPSFQLPGDQPLYTDTIPVDVSFSPFDPNQNYHDIKDVIDVKPEEKKSQTWYWFVAISILLVAGIIYILLKKKKKPVRATPPPDAYAEAKKELEKLRKENQPLKLFYTKLIDIFRLYIFQRKGIASLQETTDDLVLQLRSLNLPEDEFRQLAQVLRMSDFVKFAKYEPEKDDAINSFNVIKNSIDKIEQSHVAALPAKEAG
jgi:LPXTG-motif cell wall-anchored protein